MMPMAISDTPKRQSTNPSGARAVTPAHYRALRDADAFNGLEPGYSPRHIIDHLRQTGHHLGWVPSLIAHLALLIEYTQEHDWTPGNHPIVWLPVEKIAARLGVRRSQIQRNEQQLLDLGAIAFRDSPNYRRHGRRDRSREIIIAYGLDLGPAAQLIHILTESERTTVAEENARRHLRTEITALRRRVARANMTVLETQPPSADTQALEHEIEILTALPPRNASVDDLRHRLQALQHVDQQLAEILPPERRIKETHDDQADLGLRSAWEHTDLVKKWRLASPSARSAFIAWIRAQR